MQQIFAVIAKCFGKATVFVEIMNPSVVKHMKEKSIEGSHAKFTWGMRGGAELQALLPGFTCKWTPQPNNLESAEQFGFDFAQSLLEDEHEECHCAD